MLYCLNQQCASRLVNKFVHFCEKDRMNIEGLSASTLEKLISHDWVRTYGDPIQFILHDDGLLLERHQPLGQLRHAKQYTDCFFALTHTPVALCTGSAVVAVRGFRLAFPQGKIVKFFHKLSEQVAICEARVYMNKDDPEDRYICPGSLPGQCRRCSR